MKTNLEPWFGTEIISAKKRQTTFKVKKTGFERDKYNFKTGRISSEEDTAQSKKLFF